jgi:pimeloyl-ACP methyl ester carboxylesterase
MPLTSRVGILRKLALGDNAVHGERTKPAAFMALADAVLGCEVAEDLLDTSEQLAPLEVTCPTQIVWSERDRIFPPDPFAKTARERIPGACHLLLRDVGHVPMLDRPELVASTILQHLASVHEPLVHEARG